MEPLPQQPQQNPYDFITNPAKPPKNPGFGGNSMRSRILIVLGGLIALVIIASVVGTLLSNAGKGDVKALKDIVAQQQELVRVADIGTKKAQTTSVKALAYTTLLSVTTDQQKLTEYLGGRGVKLTKLELEAKKKDSVDKTLESAAANNSFDQTFTETITGLLDKYAASMKSAYQSAKGEKGKTVLSESYTSSTALLGIKQ